MEMSHRSSEMMSVAAEAENDLRDLLHIPENYKVLFLQGGASMQFSAVPLNLLPVDGKAGQDEPQRPWAGHAQALRRGRRRQSRATRVLAALRQREAESTDEGRVPTRAKKRR